MVSLYHLLDQVLALYFYVLIARVVMEWLLVFGVLDRYNNFVERLAYFLFAVTEPVFDLLRRSLGRVIPLRVAAVDLCPLVILVLIVFARNLLREYWFGF